MKLELQAYFIKMEEGDDALCQKLAVLFAVLEEWWQETTGDCSYYSPTGEELTKADMGVVNKWITPNA